MISCPETETPPEQDYYQPIVTMMEVELALNDNEVWWQNPISDFREFLEGNSRLFSNSTHDTNFT